MVLEKFRKGAGRQLMPITRKMANVQPNILTWFSLLFAILAGLSIYFMYKWPYLFLLGLLFIGMNSLFDLLDGDVARLTGSSSPRGDFLDHTFDRYSDVAIVLGMVLSPLCSLKWGLIAMIGMLLVSYMGTQAQAMGVGRIYGGLLGRADRLLIITLVGLGEFFLLVFSPHWSVQREILGIRLISDGQFFELHLFTIAMIYFSIAGHYTAIYRGVKTLQLLKKKEKKTRTKRSKKK